MLATSVAASRIQGRRAFAIGAVLARSFGIWGKNLIPFTILGVIVYIPLFVFVLTVEPTVKSPWTTSDGYLVVRTNPVFLGGYILLWVTLQYTVQGALIYGVLQQLRGTTARMWDCIRVGFARLLPVVAVGALAGLLGILALFPLIFPGVILFCMYWVAVPASVVEKPGVIGALKRSAELTRGEKGSIFVILLVLFVVNKAVNTVFESAVPPRSPASLVVLLIPTIALATLGAIASAVGYHDLRVSKEGVDVEDLVRVFA